MPGGDGEEDRGPAIFVQEDNNIPVLFHLHRSVSGGQKVTLEADILRYGGELCEDERDADTIIVHHDRLDMIQKKHLHSKRIYVEEVNFVQRCIERGVYSHEKPLKRNIGGRPAGSVRNEYTRSDDLHLVQYLSEQVPNKEDGGRTGNTIYQELCNEIYSENYPWAERHPWQSWRNRYKQNQGRFDREIDEYLEIYPPHRNHLGEYNYRKRAQEFGRYRNGRRHRVVNEYRVEEEEEEEIDMEGHGNENAARGPLDEEEDINDVVEIPRTKAAQRAVGNMTLRDDARPDTERLKRKLASGREGGNASPLEQGRSKQRQRRNSIESEDVGSTRESAVDAQEDNLMRLDYNPEDGFVPDLGQEQEDLVESLTVEPSNTQATLVATQVRRPAAAKGPIAGPSSLASTQVRVRAARNSERTRALLSLGTRRPAAATLPLDTQATAVPTQTNRRKAQSRQTQQGPASGTRVQERSPSLEFVSTANSPQHASRQDGQARRVEIEDTTALSPIPTPKASEKRERAARKTPSKSAMRPPTQIITRSSSPIPVPGPSRETRLTRANQRAAAKPSAPPAPTKPSQTQTINRDAPYRNTRARSRSVEPRSLPTTKRKGKAAVQAVQEEPAEVDFISADPLVETESYNEQQSVEAVENALEIDESGDEEEEEAGEYIISSDSDSDADNVIRDTARKLRESGLHRGFYGASDAGLRSTVASPASLLKPPAGPTPKPSSSAMKTDGGSRRTSLLDSRVRVRHLTPASGSGHTSENAFPTPGTRADEERKRLALEEEMQPYVPAPGTRAAEVLAMKGKQRAR
ncbi:hypothetical protein M0805_002550 [Coniferiporia weirii]|nr:hypothetical protein M0805_002550 [Coniferiporia weirii]